MLLQALISFTDGSSQPQLITRRLNPKNFETGSYPDASFDGEGAMQYAIVMAVELFNEAIMSSNHAVIYLNGEIIGEIVG
jgi:hypothetical protein